MGDGEEIDGTEVTEGTKDSKILIESICLVNKKKPRTFLGFFDAVGFVGFVKLQLRLHLLESLDELIQIFDIKHDGRLLTAA